MKKSLSVILPVYNEFETIEKVVAEFNNKIVSHYPNSELIVAEDGSDDGTKELLKKIKIKIPMRLVMGSQRKGYLKGVRDALQLAKNELVFFSDSDGQHDPNDFWKLLKKIDDNDLVSGVKIHRKDAFYRIFLSWIYNSLVWLLFGIYVKDINSGFKLMKREIVTAIVPKIRYLKYGFSTELVIRARKKGKKIATMPIKHSERKAGIADQFTITNLPKVFINQLLGLLKLRWKLSRNE